MISPLRVLAALGCAAGAGFAACYAFVLSGAAGPSLYPAAYLEEFCPRSEAGCGIEEARQAAKRAPLGAPALSGTLQAAYDAAAPDRARLAAHVLSQDPRSELARVILAEEALAQGDYSRFLDLYLPMFATDRAQAAVYADVLATLSADPALYQQIEARLRVARPNWGASYLTALAGKGGVAFSDMIKLYAAFPAAQPGLLSKMTGAGNWRGAYLAFNELRQSGVLAADPSVPGLSVPYNQNLVETPVPPPFNWQVRSRGAEWLSPGGIYAFFQGRRGETFLSQSFPLGPGTWTLSARTSGQVSETGGWFRWRLDCAGGALLHQFDIDRLSAAPAEISFDFEHPVGACEFVTLSLIGVPGSFPQPARIEVTRVSLARAGLPPGAP